MNILRLKKSYKGNCGYCGRLTRLVYEVLLKSKKIDICAMCYEEQMEFKEEKKCLCKK
jgi:hypothetical protein